MYGANYYGSFYYGEAYSVVYNITFKTLVATVITVVKLPKTVKLIRSTVVTGIASVLAPYQKALTRLVLSATRALNLPRTTRSLNSSRSTRRII